MPKESKKGNGGRHIVFDRGWCASLPIAHRFRCFSFVTLKLLIHTICNLRERSVAAFGTEVCFAVERECGVTGTYEIKRELQLFNA